MNILQVANSDGALYNFRKSLIALLSVRHSVFCFSGSSPEGSYEVNLRNEGATDVFYSKRFRSGKKIINFFLLTMCIRKYIKNKNIDIVHSYTHEANIATGLAVLLGGNKSIKLIVTVTGLGRFFELEKNSTSIIQKIIILAYKLISLKVSKFIFQNPDDMLYFSANKIVSKKNFVIVKGSGVDLVEYQRGASYQRENKQYSNVLMLSRALKQKGIYEFYESSKILSLLYPGRFRFKHAGSIDENSELDHEKLTRLGEECRVEYLGHISNVKKLLEDCDIYVNPSYYREGIPRSSIEALAYDAVIVSCNTPGSKEVVIDGWNGFLITPRSVNSLCSAILKSRDLYQKSIGRSRSFAEKLFSVEEVNRKVMDCYDL